MRALFLIVFKNTFFVASLERKQNKQTLFVVVASHCQCYLAAWFRWMDQKSEHK